MDVELIKFRHQIAITVAILASLGTGLVFADREDDIRARLQPAGTVCVMGEACAAGIGGTAAAGLAKDPETVYNTYCNACHGTGANNAPKLGDQEAWATRIAKGRDTLMDHLVNGFNNGMMPARGLCADCSDEDLSSTLDYVLSKVE
jgi:cytochrome c5